MPFWKCHYHIVWATKNRTPRIESRMEPYLFTIIRQISKDLDCTVFAVNGTEDHIHVAVSIPPSLSIAQWVKRCKGASTKSINDNFIGVDEERFRWQSGYGVLSFGVQRLPFVVEYVNNQKQHHANKTFKPYLEQME